jgi:hypothetical protein
VIFYGNEKNVNLVFKKYVFRYLKKLYTMHIHVAKVFIF